MRIFVLASAFVLATIVAAYSQDVTKPVVIAGSEVIPGAHVWITTKAFSDVATSLENQGFNVIISPTDSKLVKVAFSKSKKSGDYGLLSVSWKQQIEGEAQYIVVGGAWEFADFKVYAQEKPPVFGDWKPAKVDPQLSAALKTVFASNARISIPRQP